jgi:hypothetical protein
MKLALFVTAAFAAAMLPTAPALSAPVRPQWPTLPNQFNSSGSGSFTWETGSVASLGADGVILTVEGPQGPMQETTCNEATSVTLSGLAPGAYTVTRHEYVTLYQGVVQDPCGNPFVGSQSDTIYVDVKRPEFVALGAYVTSNGLLEMGADIVEDLTGFLHTDYPYPVSVSNVTIDWGDGHRQHALGKGTGCPQAPYESCKLEVREIYRYRLRGIYRVKLSVADNAGNQASHAFSVLYGVGVPQLSPVSARRFALNGTRSHMGRAVAGWKASCRSRATTKVRCSTSFTSGGYRYRGTSDVRYARSEAILYWGMSFVGKRAAVGCNASSCWRPSRYAAEGY